MVQDNEEPMLKRRVLYIGSSVPLETSNGLDAIQQPLRERYPAGDETSIEGIVSFLTILPGGIQLQYENEPSTVIWFPITSLTLCAAVRCITTINTATAEKVAQFVSLSSPAAGGSNAKRPAIFTAITRRTQGKRVLECHGFVCASPKDALDLVQATSFADRVCKGKLNGSVLPTFVSQTRSVGTESQLQSESTTPRSTQTQDHPVRLVSGELQNGAAPEFYGNPPEHGYFYSTQPDQVKKYNVEKLIQREPERQRVASPPPPPPTSPPLQPQFRASARYSAYSRAPTVASVPLGATMTLPPPTRTTTIPVRVVPPPMQPMQHPPQMQPMQHPPPMQPMPHPPQMQPMPHPPPMGARPRFFSPPPPMMRPRVIQRQRDPYVFMPPPPIYVDQPYVVRRSQRRRGSASSGSHSSRSSSPRNGHDETFVKRGMNGDDDASSDVTSRPRTPPTDYESKPPGLPRTRTSRREQFELRQRPHNTTLPPPGSFYPQPMNPYDYYVYPPNRYSYMPLYPGRPRSVPPHAERGHKKDKSKKKSRKNKKDNKKSKRRVYGSPSDISTDSIGYQSEIPVSMIDRNGSRIPRDFRRFQNQYKNERAFSSSLAREGRYGPVDEAHSAYSLNEHMANRGRDGEGEFNLY